MKKQYKIQDAFKFDPWKMPPDTKEVLFLKGSWKEMGRQYGAFAKEAVHMIAAHKVSVAKKGFGSLDKATEYVKKNYLPVYESDADLLIDFWKGVSETAEIPFELVMLAGTVFNDEDFGCSTISAWGSATQSGQTLAGTNMDEPSYLACYDYAVVAYPDNGNSFIANRGFLQNLNLLMNDKGVVVMNSAGQNALPEDTGIGIPNAKAGLIAAVVAGSAEEARDEYMKRGAGNGENCNIADINGHGYLVEHTASKNIVRTAGEFGERDFLINTNGELTLKMQDSLFQGEDAFEDSLPRYWTEEKILNDNHGSITPDIISKALGCTDAYVDEKYFEIIKNGDSIPGYFPVENGRWIKNVWEMEDDICAWTPEARGPGWKSLIRTVCNPASKEFFIMAAPSDELAAPQISPTGSYARLTLEDTPEEINDGARNYAQAMMFIAARDIDTAGDRENEVRMSKLTESKRALFAGTNFRLLADASDDETENLELLGKSTSQFLRCQCFAQAAQDEPGLIDRGDIARIDSSFIGA